MSFTEIRSLIDNTLNAYALAYDDGDPERIGEAFTEDGELTLRIADGDLIGPFSDRTGVVKMMSDSLASQDDQRRHLATNLVLDEIDGDTAKCRSYLTLVCVADGKLDVLSTGRYEDEMRLVDGTWLIAKRHIALDLPY